LLLHHLLRLSLVVLLLGLPHLVLLLGLALLLYLLPVHGLFISRLLLDGVFPGNFLDETGKEARLLLGLLLHLLLRQEIVRHKLTVQVVVGWASKVLRLRKHLDWELLLRLHLHLLLRLGITGVST
jgi:hypothetical protein